MPENAGGKYWRRCYVCENEVFKGKRLEVEVKGDVVEKQEGHWVVLGYGTLPDVRAKYGMGVKESLSSTRCEEHEYH